MKASLIFLIFSICLFSCLNDKSPRDRTTPLTSYVNTFIGTGGHGHTYPGATMPFGMMQLSPDTRLDGWDGCGGYHYTDSLVYGFSHTHLSGTGVSDYGDILLMPTDKIVFNNGADGKEGYRSAFSHKHETAEPGYYSVKLLDTDIEVELTTSYRSGVHKYSFPKGQKQVVILDLEHRDQVLSSELVLTSKTEVSGNRHSQAWASDQRLFFNMEFSKPYTNVTLLDNNASGKKVKAAFEFDTNDGEELLIQVGISPVDVTGAKRNREKEIGNKSFADVKSEAQQAWELQLEKIEVESDDTDKKSIFYSALYHTMIAPNIYQDVDGRYRGMDLEIHTAKDFDYYTVFSLWDTYRATHPLYTIIEQERTNDFINTFLAKEKEGGIMPIWDLSACYTGCMIGYHAVPVIADAYLKGIRGYDTEQALDAMINSASQDHLGLKSYKKLGYVTMEEESESVSKTLEYAYDDWTIAQMAKGMGKDDIYRAYIKRAQSYKNVFDPSTSFMRGRMRNQWFSPFDPYEVNFNYTEANSWQYSFYVPQDITGFINILGGKEKLESQLEELFNASTEIAGTNQVDITGLIGQYAHGNEPSHHMAYLYNFVNKPHKTQEKVHQIMTELYTNTPDGISGNEDCGQMSAWYILSSMGFYSVTPGSNEYIIGSPLFDKAVIHLENGKTFAIKAENLSSDDIYIQSVTINGKEHPYSYLNHETIVNGGEMVFKMGPTPSDWATSDPFIPSTSIEDELIVPAPYIKKGELAIKKSTSIELACADRAAEIYYAFDDEPYKKYSKAISLSEAKTLKVYAQKGDVKSAVIESEFHMVNPNLSISLGTEYANHYNGGGHNAMIDGLTGTLDYRTGAWQGYHDRNIEATLHRKKPSVIDEVSVQFLEYQKSWIFLPRTVECLVSNDGKNFVSIGTKRLEAGRQAPEPNIEKVTFNNIGKTYKHVKIIATPYGDLPEWHIGHAHDGKAWIFVDEIFIR